MSELISRIDWLLVAMLCGVVGVVTLAGLLIYARAKKKPIRPVMLWLATNSALLYNAEGMWEVAVEDLHLPRAFAALVFAVFEVCLLAAMSLAREQYQRTCVRHTDGTLDTPGHPGKMLHVAGAIALTSGIVVASNAGSLTEAILRIVLPMMVFTMWWATLTAEGQSTNRTRFAFSPTRLAERWGWLIPDEDPDFERMARDRLIARMTVARIKVLDGNGWALRRLRKLAASATADMVVEVQERVARVHRIVELTAPDFAAELPPGTGDDVPAEPHAGSSGRNRGGTSSRNYGRRSGGTSGRNHSRRSAGTTGPRRSAAESRELIAEILAQEPQITRKALANRLGISTRRLSEITKVNGSDLASTTETPSN